MSGSAEVAGRLATFSACRAARDPLCKLEIEDQNRAKAIWGRAVSPGAHSNRERYEWDYALKLAFISVLGIPMLAIDH